MPHIVFRHDPDERDACALLHDIYTASTNPDRWPVFIERMCRAVGAVDLNLALNWDPRVDAIVAWSLRIDERAQRDYVAHFAASDPNLPVFATLTPGTVGRPEQDVLPGDAYYRTEFYQDWLRPQGVGPTMGGVIDNERAVSMIAVCYDLNAPPARDAHLELLSLLMPHLRAALRITQQLERLCLERNALAGALDAVGCGVVLLDASARVMRCNDQARTLLGGQHGLRYAIDRRALVCDHDDDTRRLDALVAGALATAAGLLTGHAGGRLAVRRGQRRTPLHLLVAPLPPQDVRLAHRQGAVAIFLVDPDHEPRALANHLAALHGLTDAEARIARGVVLGGDTATLAVELGISKHTVRTHLKRVLDKTGCTRQQDLVVQALTGVAALAPDG